MRQNSKVIAAVILFNAFLAGSAFAAGSWRAPNGTVWSDYQGEFENEGTQAGGVVTQSEATKACDKLHGHLPRRADFGKLMALYGVKDKEMTDAGKSKLHAAFPEIAQHTYWTSTLNPGGANYAFTWNGAEGTFSLDGRSNKFAVICVLGK